VSGKIVSLDAAREARSPHMTGRAVCLDCRHEWQAVAPTGIVWLVCPGCSLQRGRFLNHTEVESGTHWTCPCGCDLFYVTPTAFYCPNCGATQPMERK
jgi:hypothetical protein